MKVSLMRNPDPKYWVSNNENAIYLDASLSLTPTQVLKAVSNVNTNLKKLQAATKSQVIDIFEVLDFRMLSGLVGETLITELSKIHSKFIKNPNIDGYPDLCAIRDDDAFRKFREWEKNDQNQFIKFPFGGVEIKNTFGTKKGNSTIEPRSQRILGVNKKPDWKAHHNYTNNLLAIMSDFINGTPQITMAFYSSKLTSEDWRSKQNPKPGSTMTSFSVIKNTGWLKLRSNPILILEHPNYKKYAGL
ncbi:hypothetical protein N9H65_02410 [Planktomarina temperata]|nr:hypothetical protein [Planktomarina temperata]